MLDRPDAATLLKAMAETLSNEVLPATSGGTRHAVRVVANLCHILEREVVAGPTASEQTRRALAELLGQVTAVHRGPVIDPGAVVVDAHHFKHM